MSRKTPQKEEDVPIERTELGSKLNSVHQSVVERDGRNPNCMVRRSRNKRV